MINHTSGITEFRANDNNTLIIAELPDGWAVMLTIVNRISGERHSITLPIGAAHDAGRTLCSTAQVDH